MPRANRWRNCSGKCSEISGSVIHVDRHGIEVVTCTDRTLARIDLAVNGEGLVTAGTRHGIAAGAGRVAPGNRIAAVLVETVTDVVAVGGSATHAAVGSIEILAVVQADLIPRVRRARHLQRGGGGGSAGITTGRGGEGQGVGGDLAGLLDVG